MSDTPNKSINDLYVERLRKALRHYYTPEIRKQIEKELEEDSVDDAQEFVPFRSRVTMPLSYRQVRFLNQPTNWDEIDRLHKTKVEENATDVDFGE